MNIYPPNGVKTSPKGAKQLERHNPTKYMSKMLERHIELLRAIINYPYRVVNSLKG